MVCGFLFHCPICFRVAHGAGCFIKALFLAVMHGVNGLPAWASALQILFKQSKAVGKARKDPRQSNALLCPEKTRFAAEEKVNLTL